MADRPNLLVVMPDQQGMDSLGCYGNFFVETPAVDALAANVVRFSKAFTPYTHLHACAIDDVDRRLPARA